MVLASPDLERRKTMLNIEKGSIWSRLSVCAEFISYYKVVEVFDREVAIKQCDETGWEHPEARLEYPSIETFLELYKPVEQKVSA